MICFFIVPSEAAQAQPNSSQPVSSQPTVSFVSTSPASSHAQSQGVVRLGMPGCYIHVSK